MPVSKELQKLKKIILQCNLGLGDVVMLTAAIRDLHLTYPGRFLTDVRTIFPELWENNPYITPLDETSHGTRILSCSYPLIHKSNETPHHVIHGFTQFLNEQLSVKITPSVFKGDIYLAQEEKEWDSAVQEATGRPIPFWVINAGGKSDATIKWWDFRRYQEVVDFYHGRIQFVQIGATHDYHPKLQGVIDLRGKTNVRQLIRLIHHADGVLCPVTAVMHLAAAVEVKPGRPKNRACVVVAGGREPSQWEAYPHHQFIHTNGALLCCDNGGCWKSRTIPLNDGDERDLPQNLCVDVVGKLPRCMSMISAAEVVRRIGLYFEGGSLRYLGKVEARIAQRAVQEGDRCIWDTRQLEELTFRRSSEEFIRKYTKTPTSFCGSGIVLCAGGWTYLTGAWVCVRMLRKLGCRLPVEIWHLGPNEVSAEVKRLFAPLDVGFVDALSVQGSGRTRILGGWPLKAYSILSCGFEKVLLLDADNVPVRDPEYLFRSRQFKQTGAVFWPDFGRLSPLRRIWSICGVRYRNEPEFESGQILVDKSRCWKALRLALWYNEHADFYYQHIHGDKETFHMAFLKLKQPYSMPATPILRLDGVMCQHDFSGTRLFQHRNRHKWNFNGENQLVPGFLFQEDCLTFIDEFRKRLDSRTPTQCVVQCGQTRLNK